MIALSITPINIFPPSASYEANIAKDVSPGINDNAGRIADDALLNVANSYSERFLHQC